jgi:hypothetical protein
MLICILVCLVFFVPVKSLESLYTLLFIREVVVHKPTHKCLVLCTILLVMDPKIIHVPL